METKHTPTPWSCILKHDSDRNPIYAVVHGEPDIDGYMICETVSDLETDEENVRLIVAAPDMLDALLALRQAFDQGYYVVNDKGAAHRKLMTQLDAALDKARGA